MIFFGLTDIGCKCVKKEASMPQLFKDHNKLEYFNKATVKRVFDVLVSLGSLVVLSPLLLLIGVAIKFDSKGPVFFRQERLGKDGRPFIIYKFRTMFVDAHHRAISPQSIDDDRITRIGKKLRSFGLDELPQLYNIFKSDMSFVGPRPQLHEELSIIGASNDQLEKRLMVCPGLTSQWAIIKGNIKHIPTKEMIEMDCYYVDHYSLLSDIQTMVGTILYLIKRNKQV